MTPQKEQTSKKEIEVEVNGVKAIVVIPKGFDESKIPFPIIKKEQTSNHSCQQQPKLRKLEVSGEVKADFETSNQNLKRLPADTHNQTAEEYLKDKKIVVGLPIIVKFKRKNGGFARITAKRGTEIVKYTDVLHALKLKEQEVLSKISKERVKGYAHQLAKDDKALTEITNKYFEYDKSLENAVSLMRAMQKNCNCNEREHYCNICNAIELILDKLKVRKLNFDDLYNSCKEEKERQDKLYAERIKQAKQELWDDIISKDRNISMSDGDFKEIKKRHNLE